MWVGLGDVTLAFFLLWLEERGGGGVGGGVGVGVGGCWEPIVGDRVYRKTGGGQQAIPHIVD